jgi:hypothetical protein
VQVYQNLIVYFTLTLPSYSSARNLSIGSISGELNVRKISLLEVNPSSVRFKTNKHGYAYLISGLEKKVCTCSGIKGTGNELSNNIKVSSFC